MIRTEATAVVAELLGLERSLVAQRPAAAAIVAEAIDVIEKQGRRIAFEATLVPAEDGAQLALPLGAR